MPLLYALPPNGDAARGVIVCLRIAVEWLSPLQCSFTGEEPMSAGETGTASVYAAETRRTENQHHTVQRLSQAPIRLSPDARRHRVMPNAPPRSVRHLRTARENT